MYIKKCINICYTNILSAGLLQILLAAGVIGRPIQLYSEDNWDSHSLLIPTWSCQPSLDKLLHVMLCRTSNARLLGLPPNHFILLFPESGVYTSKYILMYIAIMHVLHIGQTISRKELKLPGTFAKCAMQTYDCYIAQAQEHYKKHG